MTLSYYCSSCKKKNYLKYKAQDRFQLQRQVGDEINKHCDKCGTFEKKHINRLHAEPSRYIGFTAFAIACLLTITVWYFGFIATFTFTIPIWIYFDAYKKSSNFNKVKVSRKR